MQMNSLMYNVDENRPHQLLFNMEIGKLFQIVCELWRCPIVPVEETAWGSQTSSLACNLFYRLTNQTFPWVSAGDISSF